MLRYTTDRARPGLVALYGILPGNGAGQFLQPQSPHEALQCYILIESTEQCIKQTPSFQINIILSHLRIQHF